ncbi:hypothetical protein B0H11DRAFT_1920609 [Mycena galericulata]|nr:hypothetical protein B0H11DRAFT_1920609 [Mycena galericulata]
MSFGTSPAFSVNTTAEEVASAFSTEIRGKNVLITGTSINAIGFEATRVVAKHASLVIITGYNAESRKANCTPPRGQIETLRGGDQEGISRCQLTLDLGSLAGVRKATAEVLIHNAAAAVGRFRLTPDGLESQIATDHIGPFLPVTESLASTSETLKIGNDLGNHASTRSYSVLRQSHETLRNDSTTFG